MSDERESDKHRIWNTVSTSRAQSKREKKRSHSSSGTQRPLQWRLLFFDLLPASDLTHGNMLTASVV